MPLECKCFYFVGGGRTPTRKDAERRDLKRANQVVSFELRVQRRVHRLLRVALAFVCLWTSAPRHALKGSTRSNSRQPERFGCADWVEPLADLLSSSLRATRHASPFARASLENRSLQRSLHASAQASEVKATSAETLRLQRSTVTRERWGERQSELPCKARESEEEGRSACSLAL